MLQTREYYFNYKLQALDISIKIQYILQCTGYKLYYFGFYLLYFIQTEAEHV